MKGSYLGAFALALSLVLPLRAHAEGTARPAAEIPNQIAMVGVDQRIGDRVPAEITFRDEEGQALRFGDLFGERPILLVPVYFECTMLCGQVTSGLMLGLKDMSLEAGRDYSVVFVSIDPRDTPKAARERRAHALERYGREAAKSDFRFLTGEEGAIERLLRAIGYRYRYDEKNDQYSHPAAVALLTKDGTISRYFYGIEFPARDLRFGLIEASRGALGSPIDKVLLLCYHYDPTLGRYSAKTLLAVRVGGGLTLLSLLGFVVASSRRRRRDLRLDPRKARDGGSR